MYDAFIGWEPHGLERIETNIENAGRGTAPSGMQHGDRTAGVRHEDRGAIGDRDGQRRSRGLGDVAVHVPESQPSPPARIMPFDGRPVYLMGGRQSVNPKRGETVLQPRPPFHDLADRLGGSESV